MPKQAKTNQQMDPSAEHDPDALDEAERKMLLREDATETSDIDPTADTSDEHDPDALDEADRKMLLRDDGEPAQPAKKKG